MIRNIFCVLLASTASPLCASAAGATLIQFQSAVTVDSAVIRLGDIAHVRDADPETVRRLSDMTLAPAPAVGRESRLDFTTIRIRLRAQGANLADIEFSGSSIVRVSSAPRQTRPPATLPPPKTVPQTPRDEPPPDPRPYVLAVKYTVPKGHVLQTSDLVFRQTSDTGTSFLRVEDVIDRETTHVIRQDEPIHTHQIQAVQLVKNNDIVAVYARSAGISVKRFFKARGAGAMGDVISLTALEGRDKVLARITGYQEAEVIGSPGTPAHAVKDTTGSILFQKGAVSSEPNRKMPTTRLRDQRPRSSNRGGPL